VNVDSRKFDFVNIDWQWDKFRTKSEIERLKEKGIPTPQRLLAIAFQDLAFNAEENQRFEEASRFRYLSSELWRKNEPHDLLTSILGWLYWAASGYGERVLRAFVVLMGIWLIFASLYARGTLYFHVGFEPKPTQFSPAKSVGEKPPPKKPLPRVESLIYSLNTMALQRPDPRREPTLPKASFFLKQLSGRFKQHCWRSRFAGSSCARIRVKAGALPASLITISFGLTRH
jgi:hypothetical protein